MQAFCPPSFFTEGLLVHISSFPPSLSFFFCTLPLAFSCFLLQLLFESLRSLVKMVKGTSRFGAEYSFGLCLLSHIQASSFSADVGGPRNVAHLRKSCLASCSVDIQTTGMPSRKLRNCFRSSRTVAVAQTKLEKKTTPKYLGLTVIDVTAELTGIRKYAGATSFQYLNLPCFDGERPSVKAMKIAAKIIAR
mmetsp:Transcript_35115/g.91129  ORF Transcript_35115/g.91129 Transcript_35115/m.91129 type:complete len:192 (+) Transcript_35115:112-687(+)